MSLINEFCSVINQSDCEGYVLEFGTGPGNSTKALAQNLPNKKIHTFDGFIGLPPTTRGIPYKTDWYVGNYKYDYDTIKNMLSIFSNVTVHKRLSNELKDPSEFGIDKVCAINIDFDLYEGTIDALRFTQKAEWNSIFIRFDDWGAYDFQIKEEIDLHEKAAFYDWLTETKYEAFEYKEWTDSVKGLQSVMYVTR